MNEKPQRLIKEHSHNPHYNMKNVLITLITTSFFLFGFFEKTYSQGGSVSIHVGPSFPLSDFADEEEGGAGLGFTLGGKYTYTLNDKGLGLYMGVDLSYNPLKKSVREDIDDALNQSGVSIETYYKYINIPVTAGLNYTYKANDKISLFTDLGLGANFLKPTSMTLEAAGEKVDFNFKLSTQLAYKIGGGLLINDKYIVGLYYDGVGEHRVKSEVEFGDGSTEEQEDLKLKVSMLRLTIGIKF